MTVRKHLGAKAGAVLAAAGLTAGALVALSGTADAATCTGLTGLAGSCQTVGTVTITAGGLSMGGPGTLTWAANVTGAAQTIYDTTPADEILYTSDLRGLASSNAQAGWNITATASTFTGTNTGATLTDTTGGQVLAFGSGSANTVPTASCVVIATCNPAVTSVTGYPLFVPTGTGATPTKIYNASTTTGQGIGQIGGSSSTHPVQWQVSLPAVVTADAYKSTVTLTIAAVP